MIFSLLIVLQFFQMYMKVNSLSKKKKGKADEDKGGEKKEYPACTYCKNITHLAKFCWFRPDAFCKNCQQKGHSERVCKNKDGKKMQAQVAEQAGEHEE